MAEDVPVMPQLADEALDLDGAFRLRGAVVEVGDGVASAVGLEAVGEGELVQFDSGALGMAIELTAERTGIVLLGADEHVAAGDGVVPLGRLPSIEVGDGVLGRVLDPLGRPIDNRPPPPGEPRSVLRDAPDLTERTAVDRPLLTGIMVIDAAIPIGRGQRQLIVGDRNVGKTALGLDIVAAQRDTDVVCVYVVIGQPMSRVLAVRADLERSGALANTAIVAAEATDTPGLQYLAPYAGATLAEYFRDQGRDALVVGLAGRHALGGPGGGSVTAFPIVETTDSDISAYIPTNLISITDGQIYLDTARFERNLRPAVDVGRSVSRIGGVAQPPAIRAAARNLRITMSRFEALEAMTRVGLDVDPHTSTAIARGRIMREILRQPRFTVRRVADQLYALTALTEGWLDGTTLAEVSRNVWAGADSLRAELPEHTAAIEAGQTVPPAWLERARECAARNRNDVA